ncbi:hypothetical protein [Oscillibacter sp. 1-3]|uniref:hypothetical protein n=1 Tax=Oscillibacter sp. 1-3 TaxID=1235797 RepID=UPI0012DD243E|nr:hypothetical protein [Oscillibacter sp. 1-3]
MFEKRQNAQTVDLDPPLCVKFSCRASARLQRFALIGKKSLAVGHSAIFQTWPNQGAAAGGSLFAYLGKSFHAAAALYKKRRGRIFYCPTSGKRGILL